MTGSAHLAGGGVSGMEMDDGGAGVVAIARRWAERPRLAAWEP